MTESSPLDDWTVSLFDDDDLDDAELGDRMRAELTADEYNEAMDVLAKRKRRLEPAKGPTTATSASKRARMVRPRPVDQRTLRGTTMQNLLQLVGTVRNAQTRYLKGKESTAAEASMPDLAKAGQDTLVINPGSRYLRIGLASDPLPKTVPHVIARRLAAAKPSTSSAQHMLFELGASEEREEELAGIEALLKDRLKAMKKRYSKESDNQSKLFNAQSKPDNVAEQNDPHPATWTLVNGDRRPFYVGEEVFRLSSYDRMHLLFPVAGGRVNYADAPSTEYLLNEIETLWTSVLETELKLKRAVYGQYNVVLVVPDVMPRVDVKHLVSVVLDRLQFNSVLVHQESVCATLGAGVSYACVVDVGAQKTTVSCVEDGALLPNTKLIMPYGGDDCTRLLSTLLKGIAFPYADCNLARLYDFTLVESLKQNVCSLIEDDISLRQHEFYVRQPNRLSQRHRFSLYDQSIKAPLVLFYTKMLGPDFLDAAIKRFQCVNEDPEDNMDEQFMNTTNAMPDNPRKSRYSMGVLPVRRGNRSRSKAAGGAGGSGGPGGAGVAGGAAGGPEDDDDNEYDDEAGEDGMDGPSAAIGAASATAATGAGGDDAVKPMIKFTIDPELLNRSVDTPLLALAKTAPSMPVDEAVVTAIERVDTDERRKRMMASILVVGGGHLFAGFAGILHDRILGRLFTLTGSDNIVVTTSAKDLDARIVSWKGGAVLCRLEASRDSWIGRKEWAQTGVRLLRDRSLFDW